MNNKNGKWVEFAREREGAVPEKRWVTNGRQSALFKPDSEEKESLREVGAYRIASSLGIRCAKTELYELNGEKGVLSYNFKANERFNYVAAVDLYVRSQDITEAHKTTGGTYLPRLNGLTMQVIREQLPQLQESAVNMLFLDCLISNRDRHGNNWEIEVSKSGEFLRVAPLFDHGISFYPVLKEFDFCRVSWDDSEFELTHFEMFAKLSEHYPKQIESLLNKADGIELNDFCANRLKTMHEIFEQTRSNVRGTPAAVKGKSPAKAAKTVKKSITDRLADKKALVKAQDGAKAAQKGQSRDGSTTCGNNSKRGTLDD